MENSHNNSDEMLQLLKRYASGRIPPLVNVDHLEEGLIDRDLFEIYQRGFREKVHSVVEILMAPGQSGSSEGRWKGAEDLPLDSTRQSLTKFCTLIRAQEPGEQACVDCKRQWAHQAEKQKHAIAYMCTHGLIEFAAPILVHDNTIAVVFTGWLFPNRGTDWNPELLELTGLFHSLDAMETGVDARAESEKRIHQTERSLGLAEGALLDSLSSVPQQEIDPQDVVRGLQWLDQASKQLSQLATARIESERGRIRAWLISSISYSLALLDTTAAKSEGNSVWNKMAEYLKYVCEYFGFAHCAVLSLEFWNGGGKIELLSHYGRSTKDFPFPTQYDCAKSHSSLKLLNVDMRGWQTATKVDLERYASLPVIDSLHKSLRQSRSILVYAVSGRFVTGTSQILIVAGFDGRKRTGNLSEIECEEFTAIAQEIGLVTNICNFVVKIDDEKERQARFIEDVAHDIRSPIQTLISMAEFMQSSNPSIEAKQKTAKEIAAEVKRINELSQRVWMLEEIRRGLLDLGARGSVVVYDVINRCRKSLLDRAIKNRLTITVDKGLQDLPKVQVNENLFYHTVLNLMDNAVKYSVPDSDVRVGGFLEPQEIVVTFGNIGIGIQEDEKEKIFERYYRTAKAQLKVREGTGIGLSIVKTFADYHGSIDVESTSLEKSNRYLTIFRLRIRRE